MNARLSEFFDQAQVLMQRLEPLLPTAQPPLDWTCTLAARWHREGRGGALLPLQVSLDMHLTDLIGVDSQRDQLSRNTRQFVAGLPANHALLWGARGTGKSSLVRALLAEHAGTGLRLIEIERDHLADLPRVVERLAGLPQRFVLFCDDLSFEAGDGDYRVLKSVLDGSLERAPDNVLLYATSNRRHLMPEKQSDNDNWQLVDGEVHPNEAVEDKIALSDRFGLWLSFYPFNQDHYLSVVRHWISVLAGQCELAWDWDETLEKTAIRWAQGRGNRNGRCAYQFARNWVGLQLLGSRAVSGSY
ncbi:ATP-binding protein [Azotobacter armeniacus]